MATSSQQSPVVPIRSHRMTLEKETVLSEALTIAEGFYASEAAKLRQTAASIPGLPDVSREVMVKTAAHLEAKVIQTKDVLRAIEDGTLVN